jgi:predicted Ser/Thr protein kinase
VTPPADRPESIGRYQIVERVGRGGMGVVYRAIDTVLDREVALKVMSPDFASEEGARQRFFREAKAAARLQHRNIVTVFEFGEDDGRPLIAMEFLRGKNLADRMKETPALTMAERFEIVEQLCAGLNFAHEQGVVHRDVKPPNVWIQNDGLVKLLDFGIAKFASGTSTRHGDLLGSAAYMAPEVLSGKAADGRADVYAAGVVLYELLARRRPFEADTPTAIINKVLNEAPAPLDLGTELSGPVHSILAKALEKDPDRRYSTAAALGADLQILRRSQLAPALELPVDLADTVFRQPEPALAPITIGPRTMVPDPASMLPIAADPRRSASLKAVVIGALVVVALGLVGLQQSGYFASDPVGPSSQPAPPPPTAATAPAPPAAGAVTTGVGAGAAAQAAAPMIRIVSDPAGATVSVDGTDLPTPAPVDVPLAAIQKGQVVLRKPDFDAVTVRLGRADEGAASKTVRLSRTPRVGVTLTGPFPFEVIDGRTARPTADRHEFQVAGRRTLVLRAPAYFLNTRWDVDPKAGPEQSFAVPELGTLSVRGAAFEACTVSIDGQSIGRPPISRRLVAGPHEVRLICTGKPDTIRTVRIEAAQTTVENFR